MIRDLSFKEEPIAYRENFAERPRTPLIQTQTPRKCSKRLERPRTPVKQVQSELRVMQVDQVPVRIRRNNPKTSFISARLKLTSSERWEKILKASQSRTPVEYHLPGSESLKLTSVKVSTLVDNWTSLQEGWRSLEIDEKQEMKEYFNIIGDGFGDLMFKANREAVRAKLEEMSPGDLLNCLQKLQESKLVVFIEQQQVSFQQVSFYELSDEHARDMVRNTT